MKSFLTKWSFSLFLLIGLTAAGISQKTISGVVSDASNGEALIGANVLVKGTSTGTITDIDGSYSLRANEGDVLVISYAGYTDQEVAIGASNTVNVALAAGKLLDEVVVVGYGSQKSKEVTSAVVSVSNKEFNKGPISDPAQLLQGKVAGLQIYNRGGDPNRSATIRMRGLSTVGANVEPLVVIDGVIGASLANIDPSDIESMDVLKDGSAAAIYGSRGSSGVILITTKKGSKKGGITLSYNGQVGASNIRRAVQIMDASEFKAAGGTDLKNETDWIKEVTQTGINRVHN
nr:TonB-dependent receptor plug domain-containing protein [Saprospiraceae bacterium]